MDNNETQSAGKPNRPDKPDDRGLRKDEILRGHNTYLKVIQNSVSVSTEFIKAFINKENADSNSKSPLLTSTVKVGFIIAKKKIKRAVLRNRIRRLFKESYRSDKFFFVNELPFSLNIIFSLNDKGYEYFINNPKTKLEFVSSEMKKLHSKIKNNYKL